MRMIDADAALKALRKCQTYLYDARDPELKIELSSAEAVINNLPTIQPEPADINAKEAVYNLAEKIGIHQLFALTVELRGEPIQPEQHEGHWIKHKIRDQQFIQNGYELVRCSECGMETTANELAGISLLGEVEPHFCPNCGAKMTISTK